MTELRKGPIPDSYWLVDGELLAGEYPAMSDDAGTREKLTKFLDAGIRTFIDLTEHTDPLTKYDRVLRELSTERGIETKYVRFGIRDLGIPRESTLTGTSSGRFATRSRRDGPSTCTAGAASAGRGR